MQLRVVTANVRSGMTRAQAREALDVVLAQEPDVVALQEWYVVRRGMLPRDGWAWTAPLLGGCAVGVRRGSLDVLGGGTRWLSRPGRANRDEGSWGLEPGRAAAIVRCRGVALVSYHLVSGVQRGGEYRSDRARLVARHRAERVKLQGLVDRLRADGDVVAMGDSNFDGLTLEGLAPSGNTEPTLRHRRVDEVFSTGRPVTTRLLETGSDHRAVVAEVTLGVR